MERWLRITDNGHGEWSIVDFERNYRVCAFNDAAHGGPHIHHRLLVRRIAIDNLEDAKQIVRTYAKDHTEFDHKKFEKVVKAWKSESSTD